MHKTSPKGRASLLSGPEQLMSIRDFISDIPAQQFQLDPSEAGASTRASNSHIKERSASYKEKKHDKIRSKSVLDSLNDLQHEQMPEFLAPGVSTQSTDSNHTADSVNALPIDPVTTFLDTMKQKIFKHHHHHQNHSDEYEHDSVVSVNGAIATEHFPHFSFHKHTSSTIEKLRIDSRKMSNSFRKRSQSSVAKSGSEISLEEKYGSTDEILGKGANAIVKKVNIF